MLNECMGVSNIYFAPVVLSTLRDAMEGIRGSSGLYRSAAFWLTVTPYLTRQKQTQPNLGGPSCTGRNLADYSHACIYIPNLSFFNLLQVVD